MSMESTRESGRALFLDRDGVIIQNRPNYILRWEDVEFLPGSIETLALIRDLPFKIFIITNQSAIGRGLVAESVVDQINERIVRRVESAGGRIDGVYMCPHAPEENCLCRKPQPDLLLQAARDFDIHLSESAMIGDAISDMLAGRAAGVGRLAMVETGRGADQLALTKKRSALPYEAYPDLTAALETLAPYLSRPRDSDDLGV
jgi:D-glycero-D-manno-heptose 1,7-bisphosphate phosphatase